MEFSWRERESAVGKSGGTGESGARRRELELEFSWRERERVQLKRV